MCNLILNSATYCGDVNNVLKPLDKLDLLEGEEVEIELKKKSIFGLLKGWKIDTQSLKDELREIDG
jgi:predicted DNA-binding antitoxin AbrB/MazE fold protein